MSNFLNLNTAEDQVNNYTLIPNNTIAKVRLKIKKGGCDDEVNGLTGGWITKGKTSDSFFLNCEYEILSGEFAKRKIYGLIGISSPKGEAWGNMGRTFIKSVINSSKGLSASDTSDFAANARTLNSFADLNGVIFTARIGIKKDNLSGEDINFIKSAVLINDKDWPGNQAVVPVNGDSVPLANVANSDFGDDIPF